MGHSADIHVPQCPDRSSCSPVSVTVLFLPCTSASQKSEEETLWDFQDAGTGWGRGEKRALQNPRRHLEAEAFWAAPATEREPTSISDKLIQFCSYLKLRKNKWGNGEDFDLCCRRRTQNLRDPSFPLLPNICLYSTKWIVHQVIVFLHYITYTL